MSASDRFTLYGHFESGNVYKVALMLTLSGAAYDYQHVDLFKGATRQPAFRAINRFGELPVLRHGTRSLAQSGVILSYLAETLGRFGPETEDERWAIAEWISWQNHRLLSSLATLRFLTRFVPSTDPAVLALLGSRTEAALGTLDRELAERDFLVGGRATIADLACAGYAWFIDQAGLDPAKWPAIRAWLKRLEALPGWRHPYDLLPRA